MSKLRCFTSLVAFCGAVVVLSSLPARAADDTNAAAETERQLIGVLESNAPPAEKAITCKRLVIHGTKDAVPALAALLPDKELSSWARIPLEAIPDPAADAALRDALSKVDGRLLIGVINSIGVRRDAQAVDSLAQRLRDADAAVASAAAVALGRIGNAAATTILEPALATAPEAVRGAVAEGCVYCAEQLLAADNRPAAASLYDKVRGTPQIPQTRILEATRGAIIARGADGVPLLVEQLESANEKLFALGLSTARELTGSEVTAALVAELKKVAPERQALLLLALADRGDTSALPAVLEVAKSGPATARIAAIRVVPQLGDVACIPALLEISADDDRDVAQVAREALQKLPGENIEGALVTRLAQAQGKARLALIVAVGERRIAAAVPALLKAVDDADASVRAAALKALGSTITAQDLPVLITRVVKSPNPSEAEDAKQALMTACVRMPEREACAEQLIGAMSKAPSAAQVTIIEVLGAMGGPQALGALAAAAKEGNTELKETASRLLGEWMTTDAGPVLLDVAKTVSEQKYKIRALRGYLRIAKQIELRPEARVEMCQKVLPLCQRDDEKALVLQVLELNPTAPGLKLAVGLLKQASLKGEAGRVAVAIAEKVIAGDKAAVADAMAQVAAAGGNADVVNRAKALADQAKR
jgi:HEAT repeat protein